MAVEWRASTWGEEISLEYGKALRGYSTEPGKFRVYGSNGPIGWTEQPLAKGPGVILGRKGAYRGVQFSPDPFFVIDTAYYVVPKTELDMRWLYYAIKYHKLGEIDDGSPIPSTTRSAVYVRDLEIPSLPEQKAIAAVLGALDDKIELNRRMNATLEAMAQALFQSWFVDFDPVRAKAEGRPPAGLDEPTAGLFPAQFQTSTLGHIPAGWTIQTLGDVADLNWGDTSKTKASYVSDGFTAYSASGADGYLPSFDFHKTGVVVSAIGANAGVTWLANGKWSCIKNTLRFWANAPDVSTEFLFFSTQGQNRWPKRGSAQPFISQGDARAISLVIPSNRLAVLFGNVVRPWVTAMEANLHQSRTLATLRDTLLPNLLSGKLKTTSEEN